MNKKKTLRTLIILVSLISFKFSSAQQQYFEYTYDDVGNRIHRGSSIHRLANPGTSVNDSLIKEGLRIYPNPTCNEFTVELLNYSAIEKSKIKVYDSRGKIIFEKEDLTELNRIDLSSQSNGNYYITVFVDRKIKYFQVVKVNCDGIKNTPHSIILTPVKKPNNY